MITILRAYFHVAVRCRRYRPQKGSISSLRTWLRQFESADHEVLAKLVTKVRFVSEKEVESHLVAQCKSLTSTLSKDGIPLARMIFVSIDDAGSSSPVALNLLRDAMRLERTGVTMLDVNNLKGLGDETARLAANSPAPYAVVYVDDFIGSGEQMLRNRNQATPYFIGKYSEFVLTPVICEEAIFRLSSQGIRPFYGIVHRLSERPLLDCGPLPEDLRSRLVKLARQVHPKQGLGFRDMATMVILYSNAPNSTPRLLTGTYQQPNVVKGLFPRTKDLPPVWIPSNP